MSFCLSLKAVNVGCTIIERIIIGGKFTTVIILSGMKTSTKFRGS
jgi:hypothetical protein